MSGHIDFLAPRLAGEPAAVDMHTPVWVLGRPIRQKGKPEASLALATELLEAGANPNAPLL